MTLRRSLRIGSVTLLLVAVLTACFPTLPGLGGNPGGNPGGSGGISFNGDGPSDEPGDTWSQNGSSLQLTVTGFTDGDVTFTGTYDGGSSLPLNGMYAGRSFTLTLTAG